MNIAIEILQLQLTVNYLLKPDEWTRPKVNTERSQMNNRYHIAKHVNSLTYIAILAHVPAIARARVSIHGLSA